MSALTVAVLGGGRSSEHEVSLASAASVRAGLIDAGHRVLSIEIGRDGAWRHNGREVELAAGRGLLGAEVAFPALHGPGGEDGSIQGMLECLGVPYVGSGVFASSLCIDKLRFKAAMAHAGLPQVEHEPVLLEDWRADPRTCLARLTGLGLPVYVKPARLGSSVGIARVAAAADMAEALEQALAYDPRVIVEAAAPGQEVECSILGNEQLELSDPGEILLAAGEAGWYDYEAKYQAGGMELVVPARIAPRARERVRELGAAAFRIAGCAGLARADFFVSGDEVLLNELNTMPGFTETSVFGRLFAAAGLPYAQLLDRLVALAIDRRAAELRHTF